MVVNKRKTAKIVCAAILLVVWGMVAFVGELNTAYAMEENTEQSEEVSSKADNENVEAPAEEVIPEYSEAVAGLEENNQISEQESSDSQDAISASEEGEPDSQGDVTIPESPINQSPIVTEPVEIKVPIYNYDIVDVVVPTSYAVALNPYAMKIKIGEDNFSTEQVVSRNYGIANKSTRDKLVTVTLQLKDENDGKLVFVDSAEEALQANEDTYALYMTLIPAADWDIRVNGIEIGTDTGADAMKDVEMNRAETEAVVLKEGNNQVSFLLAGAEYVFKEGQEISLESGIGGTAGEVLEIKRLASEGKGTTAFTFGGVMNPNADWSKLINALSISVIYTYENVDGSESVVPGTGAMVERLFN